MKNKENAHLVRFELKPGAAPSAKQEAELTALANLPDDKIDTTDTPELPIEFWRSQSVVGRFYRPVKRPVTLRLDADVIEWLKAIAAEKGIGYQTTANNLLRSQMNADRHTTK